MTNRYSLKYILPIIIWMAIIFTSSSLPSVFFPSVGSWVWAKLVHVIYYGVLALLIQRALTHQTRYLFLWKYVQVATIAIILVYGASDEIHQLFTPGRHARFSDVFIDGFGAAMFILASMAFRILIPKRAEARKEVL